MRGPLISPDSTGRSFGIISHGRAGRIAERPTTERLFDTAAGLFCHKGYAATTTREIATAVGIQQASLYHHMASKEDLLYQICRSSLEQFLADVPPAVDAVACPLDRIRVLIRAHLTLLLRHQKRNVTLLTELRAISAPHRREVLALRDKYERFVRSTFEDAQTAGLIRSDIPAKYLALALLSALNHAALWFRKDQALQEDQLADVFAKLCLQGAATLTARSSLTAPDLEPEINKSTVRTRKKPSPNPALARALDAAVGLFSRKGYIATSTREVAALLGIQKASLYYHINSKEDLLYLICQASLEQIRHDVETAVKDVEDPLDRLRILICSHIESLLRDDERHSITFTEMQALSPDRLAQVLSLRDAHESLVRSVLQAAQNAGVLRADIEAKYLCLALLGIMNRATVWYRSGGTLSPSQVGQLFAVIFLTGAAA
jgi:TetR/AcrR family transcriptional regulator, cholesterol catabolism regulator